MPTPNLDHPIHSGDDPISPAQFAQQRAAERATFEADVWPIVDAIARGEIDNPFESAEDVEWERRQKWLRLRVAALRE